MKSITRLTVLLAFLGFAAVSAFAVPRAVVVEEFTNASCGPCAFYNPRFQKFIFDHYANVIPIIYHVNFPGGDVMFDFDKQMPMTRLNYYGVNSVPRIVVDKLFNDSPADTNEIASAVAQKLTQQTPISLGVTSEIDANYKMSIQVNVSSTEALADKKLRVVLVEGYHHYEISGGTNGEKDFYFVARKMFPNATGTALTLAANGSETFDFTYDIPEELYHKTLYVVAFVQDDANKDILQAARSSAPIVKDAENTTRVQATLVSTDLYRQVAKPSTQNIEYLFKNESDEDMTFALKVNTASSIIPQGWTFNIEPATLLIPAGSTKSVSVEVTAPNAVSSVLMKIQADPVGRSQGFASSSIGTSYYMTEGTKYLSILGASRYSSITVNTVASLPTYGSSATWMPMDFAALQAFPAQNFDVIVLPTDFSYFLNAIYTSPEAATFFINWLKAGMDNGAHVWLSGDLGVNLSYMNDFLNTDVQNFFKDYFGIKNGAFFSLVQNNQLYTLDIKGNTNDNVTKDITFKLNGDYNQSSWPVYSQYAEYVTISNTNTTTPIFFAPGETSDVVTGVKVERTLADNSKGRAIYTGFSTETLKSDATRKTIYTALIDWLVNGNVSVVEINGGSLNLTVGPNPAVENANVRLELNGVASSQAEVFVIDMSGKRVATLHNGMIAQGINEFNLNSASLANGSYFAIVNIDGKTLATPFNVVK